MAHLNEDGLKHLLELIKGKLGEVELASYLTHAMTTIVNKDPDGHAIFQGDKFGFNSPPVEGTTELPSVIIPFYTDPVLLGDEFKFYVDDEEYAVSLTRGGGNGDELYFISSLDGYKKGILKADVFSSSTGDYITKVETEFTINPIAMTVGSDDIVNLNHPNVLTTRTYIAGQPAPCILLNSAEFIRTGELSNESEDLGSLSSAVIRGKYITSIEGKFFNKCPLLSIVIYDNSQYSSRIDGLYRYAIFNTSSREIIVGSCNADLSNLPSGQPWTFKEYAFCANHSLTQITIPNNVIMKPNAFYDCIGLENIYYNGSWEDFLYNVCLGDPTTVFSFSGDRPDITVHTNDGIHTI